MDCPKDKRCCWDCENGYVECDASGKPSAIICRLELDFCGTPCKFMEDKINFYKAEIKRLEEEKNAYKDIVDTCENGAREEFAERLKEKHQHNTTSIVSLVTVFDNIDNLLKEMRNK